MFKSPQEAPPAGYILLIKFWAGPIPGGACCHFPLIKVRKSILGKTLALPFTPRGTPEMARITV
jgi:hypothetical protein